MCSMPSRRKPKRLASETLPLVSNATKKPNVRTGSNQPRQSLQVMRGSENVFEDLGFEAEEAANLKVRADLMLDLRRYRTILHRSGSIESQELAAFACKQHTGRPVQLGESQVRTLC